MLVVRFRIAFAKTGLACLLLLLAGASDRPLGQQPANVAPPFSRGEELVYQAELNKGLLRGIDVAEFRFRVETAPVVSRGAGAADSVILHLVGDVASKGFFPRIAGFKFHQHVESMVDPNPFTALRTNKLDEHGKRVRTSEAVFDHLTHRVTWTERDPGQSQPPQTTAVDFSEPIQDVLSVIYFLRTRPLEVGKSFDVPVSDSGRVFRFAVAVVERKRINTILGRVNAIRVDPALFGENGLVRSRGMLSIWITDDSRRFPVRAQLKVDFGTFDIKLKKVGYRNSRSYE